MKKTTKELIDWAAEPSEAREEGRGSLMYREGVWYRVEPTEGQYRAMYIACVIVVISLVLIVCFVRGNF